MQLAFGGGYRGVIGLLYVISSEGMTSWVERTLHQVNNRVQRDQPPMPFSKELDSSHH